MYLQGTLSRGLLVAASIIFVNSLFWSNSSLQAEQLIQAPKGPVILEIKGDIALKNTADSAAFDYDMLVKLGLTTFQTDTPWTEYGTNFEGVLASKVLELVGANGTNVFAEAIDGYGIEIPLNDLTEHPTLIALSRDNKRMTLRGKGPAWIIYNHRDQPDTLQSVINSRMVWQLSTLTVK